MEIHLSAEKHGVSEKDIGHAVANALVVVDLEPETDPPRVLAIGPDQAANLLEIIWLELDGHVEMVIHAMALRPVFYDLLPPEDPAS